jgi:signal transduction histidine kinase
LRHLTREGGKITVESTVEDPLPPVSGNPTQLHQVLLNLCVNARDAMPRGGLLNIDVTSGEMDRKRLPAGCAPREYVTIRVSDTGEGIPTDLRKRIFEPFFSTKAADRGTGLGLSTVLGIVKTYGGFLELTSEVGRGSTFDVHIPAARSGLAI